MDLSMSRQVLFLIFFFSSLSCLAQDRYMVFFTDKSNSEYSTENPEAFLSQRAILRRNKQQISIIEQDLPVNSSYINALKGMGIEVFYPTRWMNGVLVQMGSLEAELVEELSFVSSTELVAPNAPLSAVGSFKNEEPLPSNSNLASEQQAMMGIDLMHEYGIDGEGVLVGILDDGFKNYTQLEAFQHILNENRILYTYDFVSNRESVENNGTHGTRVFSIIGARQEIYSGVAPKATFILSVTEAPQEYRIEEYNWLFAAEKADSAGVDVINTSLGYRRGFTDPSMNYTDEQLDGQTTVITRAANIAASKGIVLVTSAGNSGSTVGAPADSPSVLAIGAVDSDEEIVSFSSRGTFTPNVFKPDVVAQGAGTLLVTAEGNIAGQNGTSFSSPLIAGLAAGLVQAYPGKTAEDIRNMIRLSGDRANIPDNVYGYGLPNFGRILENERASVGTSSVVYTAFPNPTTEEIQLRFDASHFGERVTVQLINSAGQLEETFDYVPFEGRNPLKISLEESGLYFIRVITPSKTASRKIIKY